VKVLCLCEAGVVRSGAMAWILKYHFDVDAIAASLAKNSSRTLNELADWADHIILMDKTLKGLYLRHGLCEITPGRDLASKLILCDVGTDVWKNPFHPELLGIVHQWAIAFVPQLRRAIPRKVMATA